MGAESCCGLRESTFTPTPVPDEASVMADVPVIA